MGYFPFDYVNSDMAALNNSNSVLNLTQVKANTETAQTKAREYVMDVFTKFQVTPPPSLTDVPLANRENLTNNTTYHIADRINHYYFHPDHLGSSSYVTGRTGVVTQHMEYLPFGETLTDEHINSKNSPFKYNGKEFDEETGNYYYGARYYDPKLSNFISVDPLAEKTMSPYGYCYNNPINLVDPTGMAADGWYTDEDNKIVYDKNINSQKDLDTAKIKGEFIAKSFVGRDQNKTIFNFKENGDIIESEASEVMLKGMGFDIDRLVDVQSVLVDDGKTNVDEVANSAITVLAADDASGAGVVDDVLIPVASIISILATLSEGPAVYKFAKTKPGKAGEVNGAEHTSNASKSKKNVHQEGQTRKQQVNRDKKRQSGAWKQNKNTKKK